MTLRCSPTMWLMPCWTRGRNSMSYEIDYECGACGETFPIEFSPSTPDRYMRHRMEDAEQGECAYAEPSECPECKCEVDVEWLDENEG